MTLGLRIYIYKVGKTLAQLFYNLWFYRLEFVVVYGSNFIYEPKISIRIDYVIDFVDWTL